MHKLLSLMLCCTCSILKFGSLDLHKIDNHEKLNSFRINCRLSDNEYSLLIDDYQFYNFNIDSEKFIIADVLNQKFLKNKIVEYKLICDPQYYHFEKDFSYLVSNKYVLEILQLKGNLLTKEYSIPNEEYVSKILNKAEDIPNNNVYSRLVTSTHYELDYIFNKQNNFGINRNSQVQLFLENSYNDYTNNQAALELFLNTCNLEKKIYTKLSQNSNTTSMISSDNSIVNLLPKSIFKNNGSYSKIGSEWGYYCNTYDFNSNKKISDIIIFDIYNIKANSDVSDLVEIVPVWNYTYEYNAETDVVAKNSPNNYCLGNPSHSFGLIYSNLKDNMYNQKNLNPFENGYIKSKDEGYCIDAKSAYLLGVGKQFDPIDLTKLVDGSFFVLGLGVDIASSILDVSIPVGIALGIGLDLLNDVIDEAILTNIKYTSKNVFKNSDDKIVKILNNQIGASNFENAKNYDLPPTNSSEYINTNYFTKFANIDLSFNEDNDSRSPYLYPFLFKNTTDKMTFTTKLLKSERSNNYDSIITHHLKLHIFNDNSWIFNQNPTFIKEIEGGWSYSLSSNFKGKEINLMDAKNSIPINFMDDRIIYFKPNYSGYYDIFLTDVSANTYLYIEDKGTLYSSHKSYHDINNNSYIVPNINYLKYYGFFQEDTTYKIKIYKVKSLNDSSRDFGHGNLSIALSDAPINDSNFNISNNIYQKQMIQDAKFFKNTHFYPKQNGLYTISLNSWSQDSLNYQIKILNSEFETIYEFDSKMDKVDGLKIYLTNDQPFYILTNVNNLETSKYYNLNIYNYDCEYLPNFASYINTNHFNIPIINSSKDFYFITRQSSSRKYNFYLTFDYDYITPPNAKITFIVRNHKQENVYGNPDFIGKNIDIYLESNEIYSFIFISNVSINYGLLLYVQ